MANGTNGGNGRINGREIRAELFAARYVRYNCNGVRALRAMGAKGKASSLAVKASELLRTPKVGEALARIRHEAAMDSLEAIHRMTEFARGSIEDLLDKHGNVDMRLAKRRRKLHLVKELTEKRWTEGKGDDEHVVTELKVKLYPADAATKTMMQFQGLLDVTLKRPKDDRELDALLHEQILRVHGREKGLELSKALGLKVAAGVH